MKHTRRMLWVLIALLVVTAPLAFAQRVNPPKEVVVTNFPLDEEGNLRVNGQVEGAQFSLVKVADDLMNDVNVPQYLGPFSLAGWRRWTVLAVSEGVPELGDTCASLVVYEGVDGFDTEAHRRNTFSCRRVPDAINPTPGLDHHVSVIIGEVFLPEITIRINGPAVPVDVWLFLQR